MPKMVDMAEVGRDIRPHGKEDYENDENGAILRVFNGPMRSDLAVSGFKSVIDAIRKKSDEEATLFGRHQDEEGTRPLVSFIGVLLFYSHKTNPTRWKTFYPVHTSLMNFSTDFQQRMIDGGHTIVGFFPTNISVKAGMRVSKTLKQHILHKSLSQYLIRWIKELWEVCCAIARHSTVI